MLFLRDRKVYAGLEFDNIKNIYASCDNYKVNVRNFCKRMEKTIKTF